MKDVIILRGVSGSGKTALAALFSRLGGIGGIVKVVSADNYVDYSQPFDVSRLSEYHAKCQVAFADALRMEVPIVVVDNTNTHDRDFEFYVETAQRFGYTVRFVVVENRHGGKSVHNVPAATLDGQRRRLQGSIRL